MVKHRCASPLVYAAFLTAALFAGFSPAAQAFDDWRSLRDRGIVKQQKDYSCGAAALATLLTYFYGDPVSEDVLLKETMHHRDSVKESRLGRRVPRHFMGLSFADMARLARSRDYPVLGVDVAYDDLKNLALPVIVALDIQGRAHFSVLRRIDDHDRVFLADPSWGNYQIAGKKFLESFAGDRDGRRGHILIIGPRDAKESTHQAFRHRLPRRVLMAPRL